MKSIKILIAAAIVFIASSVIAGCTPEGVSKAGLQRLEEAQEMKKDVSLSLTRAGESEDLILTLSLHNPGRKPISSAQVWLAYNPDLLQGVSIDTKDSAFELVAPYDNDFDQEIGLVMLGRSTATPVDSEEIKIVDIRFERSGEGAAMIEAYDYKQDLAGHTSANMMLDGKPVNILLQPSSPLLVINE